MKLYIFTDGGCTKNGKVNARAAYAMLIHEQIYTGYVLPYKYLLDDNNVLRFDKSVSIAPSNNRGELLGIIMGMLMMKQGEYILYTDSMISVKTINEWYIKREKNNTLHEFKNIDLLTIMMKLYRQHSNITCVHIRGHTKCLSSFTKAEKNIWYGNYLVDKYVNLLLKDNDKFIQYQRLTDSSSKVENFIFGVSEYTL